MSRTDAPETPIQAEDVHLAFPTGSGPRPVLTGADLGGARKEVVAIPGRSGSGKTTLLLVLAGLEATDRGTTRVLGRPAAVEHPWKEVAILPQSLGLLDELTVEENVLLPCRLSRSEPATDPAELLGRLGLGALGRRYPSEISLGEQQRTALARAVIVEPKVLLADEPISHQNHEWATLMMELLVELADTGTACVLATHNTTAFASAHRVLELRDGRLQSR